MKRLICGRSQEIFYKSEMASRDRSARRTIRACQVSTRAWRSPFSSWAGPSQEGSQVRSLLVRDAAQERGSSTRGSSAANGASSGEHREKRCVSRGWTREMTTEIQPGTRPNATARRYGEGGVLI